MFLSHKPADLVFNSTSEKTTILVFSEVEAIHIIKIKFTRQFCPKLEEMHPLHITNTLFSSDIKKVCFR
ncbi:hypothetical protein BACERE00177_04518 [Bacillus mobilis]|nr:hypothetical protein BACERE00177_04518 [Bacillus mobilis]